jgi:hypothetical protein
MIDMAAREYRPGVPATMHHEAEAVLTRPRASQDVEAAERAAAVRSVIRMALSRHNCPRVAACAEHGQDVCDCRPCLHPEHAADASLAHETLRACGLAENERVTHLVCSTCHKSRVVSAFSKKNQTCKECLSEKKRAREAGMA